MTSTEECPSDWIERSLIIEAIASYARNETRRLLCRPSERLKLSGLLSVVQFLEQRDRNETYKDIRDVTDAIHRAVSGSIAISRDACRPYAVRAVFDDLSNEEAVDEMLDDHARHEGRHDPVDSDEETDE